MKPSKRDTAVKTPPKTDVTGEFVVWNPTSDKPPKIRFVFREEAEMAARRWASATGETFYVCELVVRVTP